MRRFPVLIAAAIVIWTVPAAGAQPTPPGPSTTTSTEPGPAGDPGVTAVEETTSTVPDANAAETGDEDLPDPGLYNAQPPFDPASRGVDSASLGRARRELAEATASLAAVEQRLADALMSEAALRDAELALGADRQAALDEAVRIEHRFRERMADAYVRGDEATLSLGLLSDPTQRSIAHSYLASIQDADRRSLDEVTALRRGLDAEAETVAGDLAASERALASARSDREAAQLVVADRETAVEAYAAASRIYASGFVFPVSGPVQFGDSWGFARMPGTPDAHWHEGTDIMAPAGTPLVACESGVVDKMDVNRLGGLSLWITGNSGTRYYYAHLSAYAADLAVGQRVVAGTPVAAVGSTGNAQGGAPHLHFEVHPGGGGPVNPYPLLSVTYRPPPA